MAVGDTVSYIAPAIVQYNNFQPAAGVEIMITTHLTSNAPSMALGIHDGTLTALLNQNTTAVQSPNSLSMKLFITNSIYYRWYNYNAIASQVSGFTGIQIK